jgi:hypothetical protein
MSIFLGSRIPDQCRSHHQKMMKYYHSVDKLIKIYQTRGIKTISTKKDMNSNITSLSIKKSDRATEVLNSHTYFTQTITNTTIFIEIDAYQIEEY